MLTETWGFDEHGFFSGVRCVRRALNQQKGRKSKLFYDQNYLKTSSYYDTSISLFFHSLFIAFPTASLLSPPPFNDPIVALLSRPLSLLEEKQS